MANKTELPQGITYRENKNLYMWRFQHKGKSYCGYCKTLKEAKKQMSDLKYEVSHGLKTKEKKNTLNEWFEEWLITYRFDRKKSTLNYYRNVYRRYISPVFGEKRIKDLETTAIQRFVNEMARKYSKSTAEAISFLLFDCLDQAKKIHMISVNPMFDVSKPRYKERERKKALTAKQANMFLDYAKGCNSPYYLIFKMLYLSGLRIGEALGLRWKNVDFEQECFYVTQTLSRLPRTGFYLANPKSNAGKRRIRMERNGELYNLLKTRRIEQFEQRASAGGLWHPIKGMEDLVFTTSVGTPHYYSNIWLEMDKLINKMQEQGIDIPHFSPHILRHSYATVAYKNGMRPKTLQRVLGHSSYKTTMDMYVDVEDEAINQEMDLVAQAL